MCHILGRAIALSIDEQRALSLKSLEDFESLGVICGHPDDLHYEMDEQGENEDFESTQKEFQTMDLNESFDDLWTVYDNATDKPIAWGSIKKVGRQLKMPAKELDRLLSEYKKGQRDFLLHGKKRNINIMLNGYGLSA